MTAMPASLGVGGAAEDDRLAVEQHLAGVRAVHPGQGLDEGGLARAVLPGERVDLAREQFQGDVLQGPYGAEGLGHVRQGQNGGRARVGLVHGCSVEGAP